MLIDSAFGIKSFMPENRNVAILEINPGKGESLGELNKCVGREFKDEKILIKSLPERITSDRLFNVSKSKSFLLDFTTTLAVSPK